MHPLVDSLGHLRKAGVRDGVRQLLPATEELQRLAVGLDREIKPPAPLGGDAADGEHLGRDGTYRVLVCDNMSFHGDFSPVLAKHSKHFSLIEAISIGVDRVQRNFEPLARHIQGWRHLHLPDETAKLVIYRAFIEGELDAPMLRRAR